MKGERSDSDTRQKHLIITVLIVISVVLAGIAIGYVLMAPEKTVSGIVTDEKGVPLEGATVSANGVSVITTSDGSFHLSVRSWDKFMVQAEATGHWMQKLWAGEGEGGDIFAFNLTEDRACWVVTCIAYVHYLNNSNLESLIQVKSSLKAYLYIDDYAPGNEMAFKPSDGGGGSFTGDGRNFTSVELVQMFMVSGIYWDEPGACENCYVKETGGSGVSGDYVDYLDIKDVPSDQNQYIINHTIEPGTWSSLVSLVDKDFQLPSDLCVHVNATILGEEFQTILPVTYLATTNYYYNVQLNLEPNTNRSVGVYCYLEGGWILHIWEVPPE